MDIEIRDERLKALIAFHGHLCPGVLIGYRASLLALERLEAHRAEDEELVAIVENSSCSADGIQFMTGCTFGKGNFIFRDWGKQVFTLALRPSGRGVRLCFTGDRLKPVRPEGGIDREAFIRVMLDAPAEDLFDVREMAVALPPRASIYQTIPCESCGEGVMEPRLSRVRGRRICPECLFQQASDVVMEQIPDFLFEAGMLKKTPRTGYQFLGNGSETVAAHSFRTAVIGFVLARLTPEADRHKVVELCLMHDLAEARTGDHNYVNKQYVAVDEERAGRDAAANVPCGPEIEALLAEFMARETLESQLANDADQLDLVVELKEKRDLGNQYATDWLKHARKRLKTDIARDLFEAILKTDWTRWWFHRGQEHLWVRND